MAGIECIERRKVLRKMSTQEVFIQQFAGLFHYYSGALSSDAEQPSQSSDSPAADEHHLFEAARLAIQDLESRSLPEDDKYRYFARPGEAEWGC